MNNEIPISIIRRDGAYLIYFDVCNIDNPKKIEAAYIKTKRSNHGDNGQEISVFINDRLSGEDSILLRKYKQTVQEDSYDYRIIADVSEAVKMIAAGHVENKGFILKNVKQLYDPRLTLCYYRNRIYPCPEYGFFEKKISLFSYTLSQESPWFYTGMSDTITFFVNNKGDSDITIHIQNSPDTVRSVKAAQRIHVPPGETADIIPYRFSKFTRLAVNSEEGRINCDVWFQTQLRSY